MSKGEKTNLRVVRESDLDALFELHSDLDRRGEFYPLDLSSETEFRKRFHEDGFWGPDFGRLLIFSKEDVHIIGGIWYFKSVPYYDALEIGYILYDEASRNRGIMAEALSLLVQWSGPSNA